nr:hypothetical protein [Candidatus Sigynarchaeota archaeon]
MVEIIIIALLAAAGFVIITVIVRFFYYPRKNRIRHSSRVTNEYLATKFDDLLAIRAILAIHKNSGSLLYSYIIESDDDFHIKSPEFVSGVLHALRAIGKEIGFKDQHFNRIVYGNYHVASDEGEYCQVVVVSRSEPSSIIEDNILLLIKAMEKKFAPKFREEKLYINSNDFIGTIELIRDYFDTLFIEGLNLHYDPDIMKWDEISHASSILLREAAKQYKRDNTIVLKKLFIDVYGSNVEGIQKYKREEVIKAMYDLFKQNYFSFYNV